MEHRFSPHIWGEYPLLSPRMILSFFLLSFLIFSAWSFSLDLFFAHYFAHPPPPFYQWARFLQTFGEWPSYLLVGISCGHLFYKKASLSTLYISKCVVLTFLIGNMLIVNGGLKTFSGRVRPKHTTEFGGDKQAAPFYKIKGPRSLKERSFPSGHTSMAALLYTLSFSYHFLRKRLLASLFFVGSTFYTLLIGWSRMAVKAHFFSDVLVAWILILVLAFLISKKTYSSLFQKTTSQ